ncbi:MAG: aminopeptidase P family protein [Ignavibacteria bacterium]|nr:aminopeptidase P family protein [Ignavibacteria bacterium]
MNIKQIQEQLKRNKFDGWLFYDFHNRDHLAYRILGLENKHTTRRWFYFIPVKGEPKKLVSAVESTKLDSLPGKKSIYLAWTEQHRLLKQILGSPKKIAMQYSSKNNIPYVSIVDAGTIELIKSLGHKISSSADLISIFEALIDERGYQLHKEAQQDIDEIRKDAFNQIRESIDSGKKLTEWELQQYIMQRFSENNLITSAEPIVGINDNPADPHFEPKKEGDYYFKEGDTVLIDLWAKKNVEGGIYYDITWVGYVGHNPPQKYINIFEAVKAARNAAVDFVKENFSKGKKCYGWQVDDVCRNVVKKAGFGKYFIHRTGHSIGEETHGNGPNIDNLETKDERMLMPGCMFSIEPGIYIKGEMAVRTEINMFINHNGSAEVTGEIQDEIILI